MGEKNASDGRTRRGRRKRRKIIVTNILIDRKKLWLVSHKMRKKRVSKVLRKMRKRTFLGMLPSVAHLRNILRKWVLLMYILELWRYLVWIIYNFKRNIFGWKVVEHGPSVLPRPGLLGFYKIFDIFHFQTKYFWLISGWTRTVGPSNRRLLA